MRAVLVKRFGGPEVLELVEVPDPEPESGQVPVRVRAAGVNYADTYQVEGLYLDAFPLPFIPGSEVAGVTADGRRVVGLLRTGGYAERAVIAPDLAFDLPDEVSDEQGLCLVLQGLTAWHVLRTCARLAPGESVVVHAAAGGVGSLAVQLARRWKAGRIIGTASSPDKQSLVLSLGADIVLDSTDAELGKAIVDANAGKVDVVLEMIGGECFRDSLATVAPFGRLVTYGTASRKLPGTVHPMALLSRGVGVVGFWLPHCFGHAEMVQCQMAELLSLTASGKLRPVIGGRYRLRDARRAHEDLRGRRSMGKLVLDPGA